MRHQIALLLVLLIMACVFNDLYSANLAQLGPNIRIWLAIAATNGNSDDNTLLCLFQLCSAQRKNTEFLQPAKYWL